MATKRRFRFPWAVLVTLLILGTIGYGAYLLFGTGVKVPNLVGKSQQSATRAVEGVGLVVGQVTEQESDKPAGTVLSQSPASQVRTEAGATVDIVVAKLKVENQAFSPAVSGYGQPEAISAIQSAGLLGQTFLAFSDTAGVGTIADQFPAGGAAVSPGTPVGVTVSLGPARGDGVVQTPSLLKLPKADAAAQLAQRGSAASSWQ